MLTWHSSLQFIIIKLKCTAYKNKRIVILFYQLSMLDETTKI